MLAMFAIIFGAVTIWKWMELEAEKAKTRADPALSKRIETLEAEVERLRDMVADAVIQTHEAERYARLMPQSGERSVDAS